MNNNERRQILDEIKMKNRKRRLKLFKVLCGVVAIAGAVSYHNMTLTKVKSRYDNQILQLQNQISLKEKDILVYKTMYDTTAKQIDTYKAERDNAVSKYNYISEQIKYSKLNYGTPNRGSYATQNLTEFPIITIDEMNKYIEEICPSDSPFIGKGETFLKASQMTGLDPKYLFSHAAVESGYGLSPIAVTKNNYFGIAAFNDNPNNAYHMGDNIDDGIINGAMWIKQNYTNKGYTSLRSMAFDGKYCLYDDGTPSDKWVSDISAIATSYN